MPEPETKEPETEIPETETKEPATEETKVSESENQNPGESTQTEEPVHPQKDPGMKRPSRPRITKIIRRGRAFRVRWKKLPETVSGCQIQYSTSKKFKGIRVRNVYVKSQKAVRKRITGLKAGRRYYVRVRVFRKEGGRTRYSLWSRKMRI